MNQKLLLKGTLFLILAGFASRFIGFFYRIYLSNLLGSKNLGIYQLIFPIYSICFTIYASGIQTGISKIVASLSSKKDNKHPIISPFFTGALLSFILSIFLSISLFHTSEYIAIYFLHEINCKYPLQILSLVFPFCGFTSCINGFYYALKKSTLCFFAHFQNENVY